MDILAKAFFGEVGEVPAVVVSFKIAVFEGCVDVSAQLHGAGHLCEYGFEFFFGQVEDGGAGPDAVVLFHLVKVGKEAVADLDASVFVGDLAELFGAVHGFHTEAQR